MDRPILDDVFKKWTEIGRYKSREDLKLDLGMYERLVDIVQVGTSYYFVFDPYLKEIELISSAVEDLLKIDVRDFTIDYMLENIHPNDLPYFADFEATVVDFKKQLPVDKLTKYKTRYNYRFRTSQGNFLHILQQSITIQTEEDGTVLRNLVIHTDITDIAPFQRMKLSFIGMESEPSFIDVQPQMRFSKAKELFSKSERDILKLIVQGLSSQSIADLLSRSVHTVRNHRKNILSKSGCNNVQELLVKSIREGWV